MCNDAKEVCHMINIQKTKTDSITYNWKKGMLGDM